ncbi:hypothetical protein [Sulfitobacter sp. R18_1]|uniref:hypothetical protein n=1 Tax=Sulfitobacter sp. R18_1 TaxID=2821104 RepID=UPI001ADC2111|nr:hypothetical protein [Sulfitobacter sp. R18_1]MBO9428230.1 hypothetical protein [Sulfitobacter sp. R18_1]
MDDDFIMPLNLGELVEKAKEVASEVKAQNSKADPSVYFDNETYPGDLHTWRCCYSNLAISPVPSGKGKPLSEFIEMLQDAIGTEFVGYKGGDYMMNENTPVWVADRNSADSVAILDVTLEGDQVTITTKDLDEEE